MFCGAECYLADLDRFSTHELNIYVFIIILLVLISSFIVISLEYFYVVMSCTAAMQITLLTVLDFELSS